MIPVAFLQAVLSLKTDLTFMSEFSGMPQTFILPLIQVVAPIRLQEKMYMCWKKYSPEAGRSTTLSSSYREQEGEGCNLSRSHLIPGKWAACLWPPEASSSLTGWLVAVELPNLLNSFCFQQHAVGTDWQRRREFRCHFRILQGHIFLWFVLKV